MRIATILASAAFAVGAASARTIVIINAEGDAGKGLANTTIEVPLGSSYTTKSLTESTVSKLYVIDTMGEPAVKDLANVECRTYDNANASGNEVLKFTSVKPAAVAKPVGSVRCRLLVGGPVPTESSASSAYYSTVWASKTAAPVSTTSSGYSATITSVGNSTTSARPTNGTISLSTTAAPTYTRATTSAGAPVTSATTTTAPTNPPASGAGSVMAHAPYLVSALLVAAAGSILSL